MSRDKGEQDKKQQRINPKSDERKEKGKEQPFKQR